MSLGKPYTEVFSLLQQRNPVVLDLLYEQYGRRLFSYALQRWQLSESDVEDILYETFYVLILKVESLTFTSQAQFDGYIYSVFSNKLHEQFRKSRKAYWQALPVDENVSNLEEEEEELGQLSFPDGMWPLAEEDSDTVPESSSVAKLRLALATLTADEQSLLELWGQGYTYEEIGSMLHLEPAHLKVKCFRAKQKIVKWFNANIINTYEKPVD